MSDVISISDVLADPLIRLQNLYTIVNKSGKVVPFRLNWAQEELYHEMHNRNVILKARQLGISTFYCILLLDLALFTPNQTIGIISHSLEGAQHLFKKVIHTSYENLPPPIRHMCPVVSMSAREMSFANGSSIRCDTTMRGGTLSALMISELGPLCARYPSKANEVVTGSLNALPTDALCIIESTAEGVGNSFHKICQAAQKKKDNLSPLEFKFFFLPWHHHPDYHLDYPITIPRYLEEYFSSLEGMGIYLKDSQKYWYVNQWSIMGESMRSEYPSFPEEAFEVSSIANFYTKELMDLEKNRFAHVPYQKHLPCYVAVDIGVHTAAWIYQVHGNGQIHILEHYFNVGGSFDDIVREVRALPYIIDTWYLPHDADSRQPGGGKTYLQLFQQLGVKCMVLPRESIDIGINRVRQFLSRCYFDSTHASEGFEHLKQYKRKYNTRLGMYGSEPEHDFFSHSSDSMRYLCLAVELYGSSKKNETMTAHRDLQAKARLLRL